tara:strand:+ start:16976 stop:18229 length:1254 start_codon:yes stop_codon:yes gene_type:complete
MNSKISRISSVGFFNIIAGASYVLFSFLIAKNLAPSNTGIVFTVLSIIIISGLFAKQGYESIVLKDFSNIFETKNYTSMKTILKKITKEVFIIGAVISSLLLLFSESLSILYFESTNYRWLINLISFLIFPFVFLELISRAMIAANKILLAISLNKILLYFLPCLFMYFYIDFKTINVIAFYSIALLLSFLVILAFFRRVIINLRNSSNDDAKINFTEDKLSFFITNLNFSFGQWGIILVAGIFLSTYEIGIFSVILRIIYVPAIVLLSINQFFARRFSNSFFEANFSRLRKEFYYATIACICFSIPIFSVFFLFSKEILLYFGDEYAEHIGILNLMIFAQIINIFSGPCGQLLLMCGGEKKAFLTSSLNLLITIPLVFILSFYFGLYGVAAAYTFGVLLANLLNLIFVMKLINKYV